MKYFLDTNVLLEDISYYSSLQFLLSSETLIELEKIKTNRNRTEDIRAAARNAIKWLADNPDGYEVIQYCDAIYHELCKREIGYSDDVTDIRICGCVWLATKLYPDEEIIFVTHDLSCRNIAEKIFKLNVEWFDSKEQIYKGYKEISGNTEYINEYMANIDLSTWYTNEYCLINNTDDNTHKEMRFDGTMFVPLKLPPSKYIKGKNSLQRCALDMLNNPSITICAVLGGYGSGKTMLSTKCALMSVQEKGWQSKIITLREIVSEGKEIGYLPGEKDTKILDFMLPFADQLDGGEFELESLKQRGVIEANTPYFIKGRTFNESILLVDEAEDLTEKQIRLIGTRVGQNSRVFYTGDYSQSVINPTKNNALTKMCNELKGNEMFACIYLEDDVRSETSKLFANLFKK